MHAAALLALLPLALAAPQKRDALAPLILPRQSQAVPGKYIVKMKNGARQGSVTNAVSSIQAEADFTYSRGFRGFAASLSPEEVQKLRLNPDVSHASERACCGMSR